MTNTIGTVYMLFGCMCITSLTSAGTYLFMTLYTGLDVTSPIPTTVAMGVISIAIGYQFLSIFSFSSDAILQSYLLDEEMKPGFTGTPDSLKSFKDSLMTKVRRGSGCCK